MQYWPKLKKLLRLDDRYDAAIEAIEREVVANSKSNCFSSESPIFGGSKPNFDITAPSSELAKLSADHRYGLQALKPAFEFIAVAQKPYAGALWTASLRQGRER